MNLVFRFFATAFAATAAIAALMPVPAYAQGGLTDAYAVASYPARPVHVIVPIGPGGPSDVAGRLIAQKLSASLGQSFVIENQPGAGGNIGMGRASRATPDGYTLVVVSSSYVVNPSLYAKVPYDPARDFAAVTLLAVSPNILVVNPSVPATTVQELIGFLKAHPGKHGFAHPGNGTTPQLSGELFKLSTGVDMVAVAFNGSAPAIQSALAGHTAIAFSALTPAVTQVKGGKLRALAVTSPKRSPALPEVPTLAEAGLPGQEADTMTGIMVPAATPSAIVALLHREIAKAAAQPDIQAKFSALGFDVVAGTPAEFEVRIKTEIQKWSRVIRNANLRAE